MNSKNFGRFLLVFHIMKYQLLVGLFLFFVSYGEDSTQVPKIIFLSGNNNIIILLA